MLLLQPPVNISRSDLLWGFSYAAKLTIDQLLGVKALFNLKVFSQCISAYLLLAATKELYLAPYISSKPVLCLAILS